MFKMSTKLELRDSLYYDDLIYAIEEIRFRDIERVRDIKLQEDKTTLERIALRIQPIYSEQQKQENGLQGEELSDLESDLLLIVRKISKMAGESFKSIEDIRKYPELIQNNQ